MTREQIERNYITLNEIKEIERLLEDQKGADKHNWMQVTVPEKNYNFLNGRINSIRESFLQFLENELMRLKKLIGLEN